jgi:riboflavin kinase/FMN adenylyltransferase
VRAERAVPANGIYATYAVLGEERYQSLANVGVRPSFDNGERTVETYILDFEADIYGYDLVVEFVQRLRPEKRFTDIKDLIAQIERDIVEARRILAAEKPLPWPEEALRAGSQDKILPLAAS